MNTGFTEPIRATAPELTVIGTGPLGPTAP